MAPRNKPNATEAVRPSKPAAAKRAAPAKASAKAAAPAKASAKAAAPAKASAKPAASRATSTRRGPKTTATDASTAAFFASLDAATRADCEQLDRMMRAATGAAGVMYGKAIVGYGTSTLRYADGREAPWMKIGFSPRSRAISLYGVLASATPALLDRLGDHDRGKGCLYVARLADVDLATLERLLRAAAAT